MKSTRLQRVNPFSDRLLMRLQLGCRPAKRDAAQSGESPSMPNYAGVHSTNQAKSTEDRVGHSTLGNFGRAAAHGTRQDR